VLAVAVLVAMTAGCALDSQKAPSVTGPSELGLSLGVSASPDFITQDGVSRSVIEVQARNANSQPVAGLTVRIDTAVDGQLAEFGTLSAKSISTNGDGRASVVYTAPPPPPAGAPADITVAVIATPVGSNYGNTVSRTVVIRLARPSVILPPAGTPPEAPVADFFFSPSQPREGDIVLFDASPTTNAVSYAWNFGDGQTAGGVRPTNDFALAGIYTVTLTATSEHGLSHSVQKTVVVAPLTAPTASFVFSPSRPLVSLPVFFNAQGSRAPSGRRIVSWDWDFGDGEHGSGETAQHTYSAPGTFVVLLRVTDDVGRTATTSQNVAVERPGPVASFVFSPSAPLVNQDVTFNAQGSTAPGGASITAWDWQFGDGTPGASGEIVTHRFGAAGTYTVVLKVTDSTGASSTVTRTVSVQ
jgi:PKD repeat protein